MIVFHNNYREKLACTLRNECFATDGFAASPFAPRSHDLCPLCCSPSCSQPSRLAWSTASSTRPFASHTHWPSTCLSLDRAWSPDAPSRMQAPVPRSNSPLRQHSIRKKNIRISYHCLRSHYSSSPNIKKIFKLKTEIHAFTTGNSKHGQEATEPLREISWPNVERQNHRKSNSPPTAATGCKAVRYRPWFE